MNVSADITQTAENMLGAQERLRARANPLLFTFMLDAFIAVGLFFLLRNHRPVLLTWALVSGSTAAIHGFLMAIYSMNAALIAGNSAFDGTTTDS